MADEDVGAIPSIAASAATVPVPIVFRGSRPASSLTTWLGMGSLLLVLVFS
ncbi:MAG: hypothetical protein AAGA65_15125 [Actinomycetota bacterium]